MAAAFHVTILGQGFDSLALLVNEQIVAKFPQNPAALIRLKREAALLKLIGKMSATSIPDMNLVEGETPFSVHELIPGDQLDDTIYQSLVDSQKDDLADRLAQFFCAMHAASNSATNTLQLPILAAESSKLKSLDGLSLTGQPDLLEFATKTLAAAQALKPDTQVLGQFDTHGWNMAFDKTTGRLNGLYDFGDAGVGSLHHDLSFPMFVSKDLGLRTIAAYQRHSYNFVSWERVLLEHSCQLLNELGQDRADNHDALLRLVTWVRQTT